ncbi:MAG: OmpA family protein [Methylobacter sp.]|jgi:outer membrane protein OmpA-like peptidoglycan-associated protein
MRFIIFGLSIIFFTLSAIITFKALELPVHKISYQPPPKDVTPEKEITSEKNVSPGTDYAIKKLMEEQAANRAIVAKLQATIAQLEGQLKTKEVALKSINPPEPDNSPRTLAVFGGETFRSGKSAINDIALSTIDNFVEEISASQGSRVIIEGHTDNIPTGKLHVDNKDLSLRRARAIANILVSRGVSPDRISAIGYGDTHPIDSNDTEAGRAKNRRVEVKLMPGQGN